MISRTIDLAGETVHFADFGGEGPTIVLVHGLGGSHLNWLAVAPALAQRGHVVALDLPGFGRSERSPRGTRVSVMGKALARFMDAMSADPVHLVGNSMGGLLTILEGHARPTRVASALLVCPALPPPRGAHVEAQWLQTLLVACAPWGHVLLRRGAAKIGPEQMMRDMLALCCVDPSRVPADVVEAHIDLATERASTPWVEHAFAQATRSLMRHLLFGRRLRRALRQPRPRLHIVHGKSDRLVDPRASRAVVAANPRIELTELPDLGHTPQLEAPDVFLDVACRWLDRAHQN
ncbi:MAG TPA: alpha/beta fold hydrolase [Polyangiaceae bacterium]|jgi:pimeloyl-ACP methyl ester carboxylesterase